MYSMYYELAIIAFILIGIGVVLWKGGAANPVGTGGLNRKLSRVESDIGALKGDFDRIEGRVTEIDRRAATISDIERIEARLSDWERKIDRLDERMDGIDRDLATIQATSSANQTVIEAMAESLRLTNATMQQVELRMEATAAVTAQVPTFIENVLTSVATNTARTEEVCKQVDRLYDFIVERGMK